MAIEPRVPVRNRMIINFPEQILSVDASSVRGGTITQSGASVLTTANDGQSYIFNCILSAGYRISNIEYNSDSATLSGYTDNSFTIIGGMGGIDGTATISVAQIGPKAVSLDNLQTFKEKCDEIYAPMSRALPAPAGTTDAGKVPTVNSAGNGYELQTPSGGGGGIVAVDSLPTANAAEYEKHLLYLQSGDLYYIAPSITENAQFISNIGTLPTNRQLTAAVTIDNNIYILGGYNGNFLNDIVKFDSISETCTTLSIKLSNAVAYMGYAAIREKAYIFGGRVKSGNSSERVNSILRFDSFAETCTTISAVLPKKLQDSSAVSIGGNVYIFGGSSGLGSDGIIKFYGSTETCTTLSAKLPSAEDMTSAAVIGTNAYVFGGNNNNAIYKFDSVLETCTTLSAVLPTNTIYSSAAAIGTNIYIFGGATSYGDNYVLKSIVKFDSEAETCTNFAVFPTNRIYTSASAIDGKAYIFGGSTTYGNGGYVNYIDRLESELGYSYKKITSTEVE